MSSSSSKSSSSSVSSISSTTSRSSRSSISSSTLLRSTSSQTESTSSSRSSLSSLSSTSSSEIKATQLPFSFRGTKWSASKLICSGIPSIKNALESNLQSQAIMIPFTTYTIKYVSLFLGKFNKDVTSYDLVLEVYETDEDGVPTGTAIASKSISSDIVSVPGWYSFDFGSDLTDKTTPANQLLALVFYQINGNEQNFVNFYYSLDLNWDTKAYVSKDEGAIWTEQPNMTRAIVISDIFDIFQDAYVDSENHRLTFPAGQEAKKNLTGSDYLGLGEFTNTKLSSDAVEINYNPAVLSIVVDSSGSMGYNDRYQDRIAAIRNLINKLKAEYPDEILFDIISFGSYRIGSLDFESSETYLTTKLDINSPTSYTLNSDGTVPSIGDGLLAWGLKDLVEGHEYIISSINLAPSKTMVEDGLGAIIPEENILTPVNYENVGSQNNSIKYSISKSGTGSEKSEDKAKNAIVCKVPLNNTSTIRKPFTSYRQLNTAFITKDIAKGDTKIYVDGFDNFNINSLIDIFDKDNIDVALRITLKEQIDGENIITIERPISFGFENSFGTNGCLLQESSISSVLNVDANDTMVELLIKDAQVTKASTFYLQTQKGGMLEWEFTPFTDWEALLLFYAGDAALLGMQAYNTEGEPLPDLTRIDLYVDELPKVITDSTTDGFKTLKTPIKTGDNSFTVYKNDETTTDIYGVSIGDSIILKGIVGDSVFLEKCKVINIEEVVEVDSINPTGKVTQKIITFSPVHLGDWDATEIMLDSKEALDSSLKIDMPISAVDITPQLAGEKLDPQYLDPVIDPPQVEPSSAPNDFNFPNDFNLARERKRDNAIDIPLNNGVGRVRVLPITEDVIETTEEKNQNAFSFYDDDSLTDAEKIEKEKLEEEYLAKTSKTKKELQDEVSPPEEETIITSTEWTIESPVYLKSGEASSHMTAVARTMELQSFGNYNIDFIDDSSTRILTDKSYSTGGVLAKKHTVYPLITIKTDKKTVMQQMQPKVVFFQNPIQMSSCTMGNLKRYCTKEIGKDGYIRIREIEIPFVYSLSANSVEINFNVFYKEIFLKSGQMRVKIFDIDRNAIDMLEPSEKYVDLQFKASQYIPHVVEGKLVSTPLFEQINYYHKDADDLYINTIGLKNNWQEATYLPGYEEGGYTVNIENGRAILKISSDANLNFAAHLKVVAEVVSPNDNKRSTILTNTMFVALPLEIIPIVNGGNLPGANSKYNWIWGSLYCPGDDRIMLQGDKKTKYNFGAKIYWMGEPAPDNTLVEFKSQGEHIKHGGTGIKPEIGLASSVFGTAIGMWPATKVSPSVSKTINGIAQDIYVGAHDTVIPYWTKVGGVEPVLVEMGDQENFIISSSLNGVQCKFVVRAMWMGQEEYAVEKKPLYVSALIYRNSSVAQDNSLWADGWEHLLILLDLSVSYVGNYPNIEKSAPYLLGEVKTGNEYSKPVVVSFSGTPPQKSATEQAMDLALGINAQPEVDNFGSGIFTRNKPVDPITNQPLNLLVAETTNIPYGWAVSPAIRKSFVVPEPTKPDPENPQCQECYPSVCDKITVSSPTSIGTYSGVLGCWSTTFGDCQCIDPETGKPTDYHKPLIFWKEPLKSTVSLISDESPYIYDKIIMDGRDRTRVNVDVSFSGKAIPIIAKQRGVVKFWTEAVASTTIARSFAEQLSAMGGGTMSSVGWNAAGRAAQGNQDLIDLNDAWYNYYISILQDFKQNQQTQGNLALIKYKSKNTVAWKDYFPTIRFEIWMGFAIWSDDEIPKLLRYEKTRDVPALSLTQNEVLLSIQYTSEDIYESNEESSSSIKPDSSSSNVEMTKHFHECNIDELGNGKTFKTLKKNTYEEIASVYNHEHNISNFVVQDAICESIIHYHELKSTASAYINPFTLDSLGYIQSKTSINQYGEESTENELVVLHIWTEYDASRDFTERKVDLWKAFDPFTDSSTPIPKEQIWDLKLKTATAFVQESTTNDYDGFSVDVALKRRDGLLPPDGTRVQIEMQPYALKKTGATGTEVSKDSTNPYMNITFSAKVSIENQKIMSAKEDGKSMVFTDFQWLPTIKKLVPEITNDELYIEKALSKIESIGSSQLNDAIVEASSRIKKYYLDNPDQSTSYSIMTFSDGGENFSDHSFNYVIKTLAIGFDTPIYSIGLGNMDAIDKNLLNAYAIKTGGAFIPLGANSIEQIDEQIINIIKNQQTNCGIYSNIVELPDSFYIKKVIPLATLVEGSKMYISFQVGNFINNLSSWSDEFLIVENQPINLESFVDQTKNKYIKYKVVMTGDENFQSPLFLGCSSMYTQPRSCKIFSQPIETSAGINDTISEITVTHKTTNDELVEIQYGICPLDSVKETNYYNNYILPFKSGERYVVLSRSNETMTTEDNVTYSAINGLWDESLEINVFLASSSTSLYKAVNSDEYVAYPLEGKISFIIPRQTNDVIIFSIMFPAKFRILCKVQNHSLENAYIDHIGLVYGLATNVPGESVVNYIDLFESSSSESSVEEMNSSSSTSSAE